MTAYEDFVFHFTGKMNQSYVMKDADGAPVYEAICEKMTLFRDTPYLFCDRITGGEQVKQISHTGTFSMYVNNFGGAVTSSFTIDKQHVWEVLLAQGYDFHFHLSKLHAVYDVTYQGESVGTIETAGTGLMNPKYKNNPLGEIPTNGIFKVNCSRDHIPGFFLLCFAFSKTEFAMDQLK